VKPVVNGWLGFPMILTLPSLLILAKSEQQSEQSRVQAVTMSITYPFRIKVQLEFCI